MSHTIELARVSHGGYVLEFPRKFRWLGCAVTALGMVLWASLYMDWRTAGGWRQMSVNQLLVVKIFALPFGVGLLVWSTQKIAVVQDLIVSHHLGFRRRLDRASARIRSTIKSGVYLKDEHGKKLFVSNWLVGFEQLMAEVRERPVEMN